MSDQQILALAGMVHTQNEQMRGLDIHPADFARRTLRMAVRDGADRSVTDMMRRTCQMMERTAVHRLLGRDPHASPFEIAVAAGLTPEGIAAVCDAMPPAVRKNLMGSFQEQIADYEAQGLDPDREMFREMWPQVSDDLKEKLRREYPDLTPD